MLFSKPHRNQNIKFLITVGTDKFYSNGLDLERLASSGAEYITKFVRLFNQLLTRILTFPLVTVAAMNGELIHIPTYINVL